jgi:exonuclease III
MFSALNRVWHILDWNVIEINRPEKWPHIRNKLEKSNASIVCLQETKRINFDASFIKKFAPRRFNKFAYVPSDGASERLLVLWVSNVFSGMLF